MKILSGFLLVGACLGYTSHQGYAGGDLVSSRVDSEPHSFVGLTLGAEFIRMGHPQTLSLIPPFLNHYTNTKSYQSSALLGVGLGMERGLTKELFWQLGLSGYFNTAVSNTGRVWQFALPEFDNFIYDYHIKSNRLMATGKLLSTIKQSIHPFVSGELGAGFNRASSYRETPLISEAVPMAPFMNHTQTSLAWGAGAGIDVDINTGLRLGLGYQFANLGKASFSPSIAQSTQQTLQLAHLYSQEVRLQLTAFI